MGAGGEADPRAPPARQAAAQGGVPAAPPPDAGAARQGAGADQTVGCLPWYISMICNGIYLGFGGVFRLILFEFFFFKYFNL